ncbi:flagellar basal body rod protein FlgC [Rhodocyclus tenuis]|uniref:Flagellar basal-body rod protein FlgC n=1 Tax=Rhodocyclus tenuis TaxID=1066 RepID=A0A840G5R2_RHOTE|nr:flagellar basal body rod protein FlgC [Rhodocyclus tenuis]MBB4246701.1 flagellar basal-body rod protein FlgC [Rhodocyclus tenuis]MBK1679996.1 flagellar basal body rod protein FlgC [Rhodocyclus tenuis]
MSMFNVFHIAGGALTAQSMRLNTVASNLANADSAVSSDGKPYRAKQVVFEAIPVKGLEAQGVRVKQVVEDASPPRLVYDPRNPAADDKGYVAMPNVSVVDEMVNMISASRSYQNNVEVMNTAKQLLLRTLTIGQ